LRVLQKYPLSLSLVSGNGYERYFWYHHDAGKEQEPCQIYFVWR
jgi:hypothetical protein